MDQQISQPIPSKQHKTIKVILFILFLVGACIVAFFWWRDQRRYITTDDAHVASYRVNIASPMVGVIDSVFYTEGSTIKQGDTLFSVITPTLINQDPSLASTIVVTAPIAGTIAKQWLISGDMTRNGQTVVTINQNEKMWIAVYLEETKFSDIYLNQPVLFSLSAYPHLQFYGKIIYISQNTASEFALVPAANASGNFTKVTQRIGLKVSIDSISTNTGHKQNPRIVSGMSATVRIIRK